MPDQPARCPATYPRSASTPPNTRSVHCHLEAGHPGEHEEADTEVTWLPDDQHVTTNPTGREVLDLALPDNDSGEATVRGYLIKLLTMVWDDGEGFNGKRPFGNSGWQGDFDKAFIEAGWVTGKLDEDGWVDDVDDQAVNALIHSAIRVLAGEPTSGGTT